MSASELTDEEYNDTEIFKPILGNKKNYQSLAGTEDQKNNSSQQNKLAKRWLVACGISAILIIIILALIIVLIFFFNT